MADSTNPENFMKPGLAYIDERTKQFRYADDKGDIQWTQPVSRYKALTEIKRGQAVSVATKDDLYEYVYKNSSLTKTTDTNYTLTVSDTVTTGNTLGNKKVDTYTNTSIPSIKYIRTTETYFDENGKQITDIVNQTYVDNVYTTFPYTVNVSDTEKDEYSLSVNGSAIIVTKTVYKYDEAAALKLIGDPETYVVLTDTRKHEKSIGLSMEYASGFGDYIHIASFGKFVFDSNYEGKQDWFYKDTTNTKQFDHTGKEYNPGFTYADVGKKVYVKWPSTDSNQKELLGELTTNDAETYKNYHNIICIGTLTDAPLNTSDTQTIIEIAIDGDQRGLVDATQYEITLGEDIVVDSTDPIRVLAIGQEEDTKFKARICLTPQGGNFSNTDFIAFQKMDGNTSIIYFGNSIDLVGTYDEDKAFLHMANCYANIAGKTISTLKCAINDTINNEESINSNIKSLNASLSTAFKAITSSTTDLSFSSIAATKDNYIGVIDLESTVVGGYYTLYVSETMRSRLNGTTTLCGGSFSNKGKAVNADIRIPTRRELIGIYYGNKYNTLIPAGTTTLALRLGDFDLPDESSEFNNWEAGQAYYLGTNGHVVTKPYNQYDFVSKIGFVKSDEENNKRFLVDIRNSTRHYNGDLPVGYMKPSVRIGSEYGAEYGFLLMDGKTQYLKSEYDALYTRLLGWFDEAQLKADTGFESYFRIPKVTRMIPDTVTVVNSDGTTEQETKQVAVPMQIKAIPNGIYEEMPRIPFKRFFGKFNEPVQDEITSACLDACDISDIVDYGICEDGFTKPTLDTLDIHLFVDPNENYDENGSEPHDWHEVHEGFFNYNNSNVYGYTWKINEYTATPEHPYGQYTLSMEIGEGGGVAYVDGINQAPKRMLGCCYKLYVARREVFARQFDIEAIYRNYITDSIYTDGNQQEVNLHKAVSGKAVIDAIKNIKTISTLSATDANANINLGTEDNPINVVTVYTKNELPIVSTNDVYIGNTKNVKVLEVTNGKLYKRNYTVNDTYYGITAYSNGYLVTDDEILSAKQIRQHTEATIDNKDYKETYLKTGATNKTGIIHGMIFGKDGNIDVASLWGIKPSLASNIKFTDNTTLSSSNAYIPTSIKNGDTYETYIEGDVKRVKSGAAGAIITEKLDSTDNVTNYFTGTDNNASYTSGNNTKGSGVIKETQIQDSVLIDSIDKVDTSNKVVSSIKRMYDVVNGELQIFNYNSNGNTYSGTSIYAGKYTSASLSKYKRIHGELIRDNSLETTSLATDSIKYTTDSDNKLKYLLGSALQAAYELPLAYWQYNTEKDWSQDSLGIIIERVKDVANNIKNGGSSTYAHLDWDGNTARCKTLGSAYNNVSISVIQNTDGTFTINEFFKDNLKNSFNLASDYSGTYNGRYNVYTITKLTTLDKTNLFGGETKTVIRNITTLSEDSDYKENEFHYTDSEEASISEFLNTIIDSSGNGQNITSTVGMLLMAAKESQERLLKLEASTFGRDYDTIPGGHEKYNIAIPGVTPDPTNYGLNRLIRAICKELYLDTNPFDINGNATDPTSSFSKIDHINQDIHGSNNADNATDYAPNEITAIDSTTYPYPDMISDSKDSAIRLGTSSLTDTNKKTLVTSRGTGIKTRIDIDSYTKDSNNEYLSETANNTATNNSHFNGLVDAVYRITTKLDALTVSINNSNNIADTPVRLDTIRDNIATIIKETYFDGQPSTNLTNGKYTTTSSVEYKDESGENNKSYSGGESRLDKLSKALYGYTLSLTTSYDVLNLGTANDFGTEGKFYTNRTFNGKSLLISEKPTTSGNITVENVKMATPTNLSNYDYATVVDILIDAIGEEWFRKAGKKADTVNASKSLTTRETRVGKTISDRLNSIEKCLDVIVSKISRKHNFEDETNNGIDKNDIDNNSSSSTSSKTKVYSIEKYLGFLNEYIGTEQYTNDELNTDSPNNNSTFTQKWVNGIDKIDSTDFGINDDFSTTSFLGTQSYSAEWTIKNRKYIHAGLVNMIARLEKEEGLSFAFDKMLGDDFNWKKINTNFKKVEDTNTGVVTWNVVNDNVPYTLTDDIKDILLTLYGQDIDELPETLTNYITDNKIATQHRTLVNSQSNANRFVFGGKNIVDAIVNEMYYLPQPVRLGSNNTLSNISASTNASEDSRSAKYYDFDAKSNVYDIINNEKALGYGNRNEFFNDIGYFNDNEITGNNDLHYRWSRFEVIENEIRNLRHLIGNDLQLDTDTIYSTDWQDLKFNGNLKYYADGNKFNDIISSNINSTTGSQTVGDTKSTNILQFILNTDAANKKLRAEFGTSTNQYYDPTYSGTNAIKNSGTTIGSLNYTLYQMPAGEANKTIYDRVAILEKNATQVDAWLDSIKDNYREPDKSPNQKGNLFSIIDYLGNFTWANNTKWYGNFRSLSNYLETTTDVNNIKSINSKTGTYATVTDNLSAHNEYIQNIYDIIGFDGNSSDATTFIDNDDKIRNVAKQNTLWARINAVETLNKNDVDITNVLSTSNNIDKIEYKNSEVGQIQFEALDINDTLTTSPDNISVDEAGNQSTMITSKQYVDNSINVAYNTIINKTGTQHTDETVESGTYENTPETITEKRTLTTKEDGTTDTNVGTYINYLTIKDDNKSTPLYGNEITDILSSENIYVKYEESNKKLSTENIVEYSNIAGSDRYYVFNTVESLNKEIAREEDVLNGLLSRQNVVDLVDGSMDLSRKNNVSINNVYKRVNSILDTFGYSYDDYNTNDSNDRIQATEGSLLQWDNTIFYSNYPTSIDDYGDISDEDFANFRSIGFKDIYRGASISNTNGRADTVSSLLNSYNITSTIDVSDIGNIADASFKNNLLNKLNNIYNTLSGDSSSPVYVYCNDGIYYTGIICMVLEAIVGVSDEEILNDFMESYKNYFGLEDGTDDYNDIKESIYDAIYNTIKGDGNSLSDSILSYIGRDIYDKLRNLS